MLFFSDIFSDIAGTTPQKQCEVLIINTENKLLMGEPRNLQYNIMDFYIIEILVPFCFYNVPN